MQEGMQETPCYNPVAMTSAYPGAGYPGHVYPMQQYPSIPPQGYPYGSENAEFGSRDNENNVQPQPQSQSGRQIIKFEPVATESQKEEKAIIKVSERKASAKKTVKSAKRNNSLGRASAKVAVNSPWLGR
jgi:hypothetical protein